MNIFVIHRINLRKCLELGAMLLNQAGATSVPGVNLFENFSDPHKSRMNRERIGKE